MLESSTGPIGWGRVRKGLIALGATVLTAFAVSAISAGAAQAQDPLDFEFVEVRANLGDNKGVALVDPAVDDPATFSGEVDPATGDFTIPTDGVSFPGKTLQVDPPAAPLPVDVLIETTAVDPVTGNFDAATGVLDVETFNANVMITVFARGASDPLGQCEISPVPLPLQTTGEIVNDTVNPPITYAAAPFAPPSGDGAAVATWESLPEVTVISDPTGLVCPAVTGLVEGPGGIWLSTTPSATPGAPDLALSVRPANKSVKQGKSATFTGTVRNTGDANASGVRVCVKAPKKVVKVKQCVNVGALAAGDSEQAKFKAKVKGNAKPKTYTLRFRATAGGGVDPATDSAKLKVQRKR
jgi:Domain of unknown function DUF11